MTEEPKTPDISDKVGTRIVEALLPVLTEFPDIKTLAVSIGWNGDLNDRANAHGVWFGPSGPVTTPDAIVVSLFQTLRMFDQQAGRALNWLKQYRQDVIAAHQEHLRGQTAPERSGPPAAAQAE